MNKQKGFTLLDISLAAAIVGVLAVMVIPYPVVTTNQAKQNSLSNNVSAIVQANDTCYISGNCPYSTTCAGLGAVVVGGSLPSGYTVTYSGQATGSTAQAPIGVCTFSYDGQTASSPVLGVTS